MQSKFNQLTNRPADFYLPGSYPLSLLLKIKISTAVKVFLCLGLKFEANLVKIGCFNAVLILFVFLKTIFHIIS
jgi:hypothetical protein